MSAKSKTKTEYKKRSQLAETWRRIRKNKLAVTGLIIFVLIVLLAIFAPYVAPYGYDEQNVNMQLKPPGTPGYILGTDNLGRDILSRLIWGARFSLQCGLIAVVVSTIGGCLLGAIAGYFGGILENVIMRLMDILMAIPGILLAIAIGAALGPGMKNAIIAIGIAGIPGFARIIRSSVMSVKEMEYVEAAKSINAGDMRILMRHIMPNVMAPLLVQATLSIANAIIQTASLSFLGLGVQAPLPEWGAMISGSRSFIRQYSYMVTCPGIAIILAVFSINVLGDGLRDALDPKLKT